MAELADLGANNLLLSAVSPPDRTREICHALLGDVGLDGVVGVTIADDPDSWLEWIERDGTGLPPLVSIVDVGEGTRSVAAGNGVECDHGGASVSIDTVPSPGNLTKLGVALTNAFQDVSDGTAGPVSMCFRDLSVLFQYADTETVFRFLNVLTDHVRSDGIRAHYHLHPDTVDAETESLLRLVFEGVVSVAEDGTYTIEATRS